MGMGIELRKTSSKYWGLESRRCDSCKTAAALLFCRADSAYLCGACDARIHSANLLSRRHERVWLCEVCEQSPAVFTCKADAAALCDTCDADIHSANPLSRRHERVPVVPFLDSPVNGSGPVNPLFGQEEENGDDNSNEAEAESWILPNPNQNHNQNLNLNLNTGTGNGFTFGFNLNKGVGEMEDFGFGETTDVDPFVDLERLQQQMDSVVPVRTGAGTGTGTGTGPSMGTTAVQNGTVMIDFASKPKPTYSSFTVNSFSPSMSSSEVGVVPDVTKPPITIKPEPAVDREARLMRYREKRKNRKFEKTIRYASRKAYAETRPRIKGRFAKRTDTPESEPEEQFERMFGFMMDQGYGVVPTF
ncbi:hypothetical protein LUZ60_017226 [Juncus effusus]|nr:hypothetical protein LUZ60_017226 [Juncus effusus]